jgi:hypothetical protein
MHVSREEELQLPLTFDHGTRWDEWSASRPGRALPPGKDPPPPLDRRLGGLRAGLGTEAREIILCLWQGSKPGSSVCSHHTILTELGLE